MYDDQCSLYFLGAGALYKDDCNNWQIIQLTSCWLVSGAQYFACRYFCTLKSQCKSARKQLLFTTFECLFHLLPLRCVQKHGWKGTSWQTFNSLFFIWEDTVCTVCMLSIIQEQPRRHDHCCPHIPCTVCTDGQGLVQNQVSIQDLCSETALELT